MTNTRGEKSDGADTTVLLICSALIAPLFMWKGYTLSVLWSWFVVPLGLPAVGMWHAAGLLLIVEASRARVEKEVSKTDVVEAVAVQAIAWAFALGLGFVFAKLGGMV
jgi:hypothetical protein